MTEPAPAVADMQRSIDDYIDALSEKHRLHRKIQFLLDVRGLLVINHITGDYVEFGVYRGEMMYAAAEILSARIGRYVGLDTFHGLPEPQPGDEQIFVFEKQGFMAAPREVPEQMMVGVDARFIEGDFRRPEVQQEFADTASEIAILVIDCNWPSSVRAAMEMSAPYLQSGSILFIDDYFVGTRYPSFNEKILRDIAEARDLRFIEFKTYPPCGRAFIVEG
jgi:hypothetical protein